MADEAQGTGSRVLSRRSRRRARWPWLLAATLAIAIGLVLGLPRLVELSIPRSAGAAARPSGPAGPSAQLPPAPAQGALPPPPTAAAQAAPTPVVAAASPAGTLGEPVRVELAEAQELVEAGTALVIDARGPTAFAEAHL